MTLSRRVRARSLFFSGRVREKMDRINPQAESLAGKSRGTIMLTHFLFHFVLFLDFNQILEGESAEPPDDICEPPDVLPSEFKCPVLLFKDRMLICFERGVFEAKSRSLRPLQLLHNLSTRLTAQIRGPV